VGFNVNKLAPKYDRIARPPKRFVDDWGTNALISGNCAPFSMNFVKDLIVTRMTPPKKRGKL
jgi:hypothetical protein